MSNGRKNRGGSKLNETARSYKNAFPEASTIEGFSFVWFTDGIGWKSAKGNLRETFEAMEHVYNIDDMEHSVMTELLRVMPIKDRKVCSNMIKLKNRDKNTTRDQSLQSR